MLASNFIHLFVFFFLFSGQTSEEEQRKARRHFGGALGQRDAVVCSGIGWTSAERSHPAPSARSDRLSKAVDFGNTGGCSLFFFNLSSFKDLFEVFKKTPQITSRIGLSSGRK